MKAHSTCLGTTRILGAVLLLGATWVPAGAQGAAPMLAGTTIQGDRVMVRVSNPTSCAIHATVVADVVLADGTITTASAPVNVPGGGFVTVVLVLPEEVRQVLTLGSVLDDGTPFGPG